MRLGQRKLWKIASHENYSKKSRTRPQNTAKSNMRWLHPLCHQPTNPQNKCPKRVSFCNAAPSARHLQARHLQASHSTVIHKCYVHTKAAGLISCLNLSRCTQQTLALVFVQYSVHFKSHLSTGTSNNLCRYQNPL